MSVRSPAGEDGPDLPSRIVLVGFMASGKSTVGRRLADRIGYRFVDLDERVAGLAGRTIPEIFRRDGESAFRSLEARATRELDGVERVVVAAGGGWMTRPALRDRWPDAVRVWLKVGPEEAVRRLGKSLSTRPLLDAPDPVAEARRILAGREAAYAGAELAVETGGRSPAAVVDDLVRRLTVHGAVDGT